MMRLVNVFVLISLLFLVSCDTEGKSGVSGVIEDGKDLTLYLDKTDFAKGRQVISKTETTADGSFKFELTEPLESGIYSLRMGRTKSPLVIGSADKAIRVTGTLDQFAKNEFNVTGSAATSELLNAFKTLGPKSTMSDYKKHIETMEDGLATSAFVFAKFRETPSSLAMHKVANDRIIAQHPESVYATQYVKVLQNMKLKAQKLAAREKIKVGEMAPDIVMNDLDGNERRLSDLRGQVVLIDFWASWCGPCRRANPHVVETYHEYKNKGFDVFSVSLDGPDLRRLRGASPDEISKKMDSSKKRWEAAIKKDGLVWTNHVSLLKKWDCPPAKAYGVSGIPKTFLVDKEGKIAVIDPTRKGDLATAIERLL